MSLDRRLHTAQDGTQNCDRTLLGKHVFHRNTKYVQLRGHNKRKKILDEFRCECGQPPRNDEYVREQWKPGRVHEDETIRS